MSKNSKTTSKTPAQPTLPTVTPEDAANAGKRYFTNEAPIQKYGATMHTLEGAAYTARFTALRSALAAFDDAGEHATFCAIVKVQHDMRAEAAEARRQAKEAEEKAKSEAKEQNFTPSETDAAMFAAFLAWKRAQGNSADAARSKAKANVTAARSSKPA